jgi:hypothetical protein
MRRTCSVLALTGVLVVPIGLGLAAQQKPAAPAAAADAKPSVMVYKSPT